MAVIKWIAIIITGVLYVEVLSKDDDSFAKASNCFSINLMGKLKRQNGNLIMSGLSVDVLMNMLAVGAGGTTAQELDQALQNTANGLTSEDVKKQLRSTMQRLTSMQDVNLDVANAIYVNQSYPLSPDYKTTVEDAFLAKVENADFRNKAREVTRDINNWVDEKTNSLIKKLLDKDIDSSTVMVLLNAIYFKGDWLQKFDAAKTKPQPFYTGGHRNIKKTVPLMRQEGNFAYKDDDNLRAQVLRMDYKGEKISFVAVLPHKDVIMEDFEKGLNCQSVSDLLDVTDKSLVQVFLPKFDMSSDLNLVQPLKNLGLVEIFDRGNLSGIGPGDLKVTDVLQKAMIKVDEEGSEAAAVTAVLKGMGRPMAPPRPVEFRVDRPFYFFILENSSRLILFAGKVYSL